MLKRTWLRSHRTRHRALGRRGQLRFSDLKASAFDQRPHTRQGWQFQLNSKKSVELMELEYWNAHTGTKCIGPTESWAHAH